MLSLGRISYLIHRYVLVRNNARSNSAHHASILNPITQMPEAITFQCPLSTVVMAGDGDAVGLRSELLRANDLRFDATRKMSQVTGSTN